MTKPDKTEEVMPSPAVPAAKFKGKHPVVADGCDVYFNGMCFRAGDEMRGLPEEKKAELFDQERIV